MSDIHTHIVSYKSNIIVLLSLLVLTGLSVFIVSVDLGTLGLFAAMVLASIKSTIVLMYFMHLKYEGKTLIYMFGCLMFAFVVLFIITFLDYSFRDFNPNLGIF